MIAEGGHKNKIDAMLAKNPDLRDHYDMYVRCRSTQLEIFRKPKGTKGAEQIVTVVWPTGFTTLPSDGGWEDQGYLISRLMVAALRGEQEGVSNLMKKP